MFDCFASFKDIYFNAVIVDDFFVAQLSIAVDVDCVEFGDEFLLMRS